MTERRLRVAAIVLGAVGLAIAAYLSYVHFAGVKPACAGGGGGCERVQSSAFSQLAGIPVAVLGGATYAVVLLTLASYREVALLTGAGVALVGFGFSAYLTYLELFEIYAICQWCVANAAVMTALAAATVGRAVTA